MTANIMESIPPGPRQNVAEAMSGILQSGECVQLLARLMRAKLEEAHEELEAATDDRQIFRVQGRAHLARELLNALTRNSAN